MQAKDFIYYEDKNKKICSLGIEIDNILTNKGGLFRKNLGVPMSLFLLNNEKNALIDVINNIHSSHHNSNTKKTHVKKNLMETSCIGNEIFEKLIELRKNAPKKQKKSRRKKLKRNKKNNKRTRKSFFF
tara:strand:+ start:1042 stop:1428 length:387 start_codon:yes stop_codon:yes gene_type:complete